MVYCGVPSKGCAPCRAKRTKCDQATPSCSQCRRAHRQCPGYRDEQTLAFRDETKKVINKAVPARAGRASKSPAPLGLVGDFDLSNGSARDSATSTTSEPINMSNQLVSRNLSVPLEDRATCFFFDNFVSADRIFSMGSNLKYLPNVIQQDCVDSALSGIVIAIGMASISNTEKSPELMLAARQKHSSVLRVINASLQDPEKAKADPTFAAVLLLGLFETVTCSSPQSMKSWANHISGATAIARIRGQDQLQNTIGRAIFAHLRTQILIDCLQRRLIVPQEVLEWSATALECDPENGNLAEQKMFQIIARLCDLRSIEGDQWNDNPTVINIAQAIDVELAEWVDNLPWDYAYMTRTSKITDDAYSDNYHIYKSVWIVGVWNTYRCARILNNQVITHWLVHHGMLTPPIYSALYQKCEILLAQLAHDICDSVPFVFIGDSSTHYPRAAAGTTLLWPLYVAATMDIVIPRQRAWVIRQLDRIGGIMGIQQATSLAKVLRIKKEITSWERNRAEITGRVEEGDDDDW